MSRYEARRKFEEHERGVKVARVLSSPDFPSASYLAQLKQESVNSSSCILLSYGCTWEDCYRSHISRSQFVDVVSVLNKNLKYVRAIGFDWACILDMM